jgi:hypothetical protein
MAKSRPESQVFFIQLLLPHGKKMGRSKRQKPGCQRDVRGDAA